MPELYEIEENHPILQSLIEGNQNWIQAQNQVILKEEAKTAVEFISGQDPDIVVITCADSRVIPEFIFDAKIGQLFVIRIAGNVMTPEVVASIEFAIEELDAKLVVVLGHQNCGAVQGRLKIDDLNGKLSSNMKKLLEKIEIVDENHPERLISSVKLNTEHQLRQILRMSESLFETTKKGKLDLVAGIYSIESKKVEFIL